MWVVSEDKITILVYIEGSKIFAILEQDFASATSRFAFRGTFGLATLGSPIITTAKLTSGYTGFIGGHTLAMQYMADTCMQEY